MTRAVRAAPPSRLGHLSRLARVVAAVLATLTLVACGSSSSTARGSVSAAETAPRVLTVFAAASLQEAATALATRYEATHAGVHLVVSTDASSALRAKIEQGAPADVFLSADVTNPQTLAKEGMAAAPPIEFARNELTIVVPAANPASIANPADLARPGLKIVAAGDAVPITKYATELLSRLATLPGYPTDFAARVEANVVSREDNVRAVLAKIELGEGDAAVVYVTDARSAPGVRVVAIRPQANVPATYAAIALRSSGNAAAAATFVGWLTSPDARGILGGLGFLPAR